jgi:hypothetical protein
MSTRSGRRPNRNRGRRALRRTAVGLGLPAALAGGESARATPVETLLPGPVVLTSGEALSVDVNQDGVDDVALSVSSGPGPISISLDFLAPETGAVPERLGANALVGPGSSFALSGFDLLSGLPGWPSGGTWMPPAPPILPPQPPIIEGFIGVAMPPQPPIIPPAPPIAPQYGWLHLSLDPGGASATLDRYGYETDPGTPVLTGVPEPTSGALLGFGLLVLDRLTGRRRR